MQNDKNDTLLQKQRKYLMLIGANLIDIQRLEGGLKQILRMMSSQNKSSSLHKDTIGLHKFHKITMGGLLKQFKESADVNEGFEELVEQLLQERNILAHHLLEIPGFNLTTLEGLEHGIRFLQEQRKTIEDANSVFMKIAFGCLYILVEIHGIDGVLSHEMYQQLKQQILSNVEFIDETFPEKTLWENTRIVRFLIYAAAACADDDGWATLSMCGHIVKNLDPECTSQKYGCKSLSEVLNVSKMFEIKRIPHENSHGIEVYYRPNSYCRHKVIQDVN